MKTVETGSSFIGARLGNMEVGPITRDFESWRKGAVEVERLFLRKFCEENLEVGLRYWGPRNVW